MGYAKIAPLGAAGAHYTSKMRQASTRLCKYSLYGETVAVFVFARGLGVLFPAGVSIFRADGEKLWIWRTSTNAAATSLNRTSRCYSIIIENQNYESVEQSIKWEQFDFLVRTRIDSFIHSFIHSTK